MLEDLDLEDYYDEDEEDPDKLEELSEIFNIISNEEYNHLDDCINISKFLISIKLLYDYIIKKIEREIINSRYLNKIMDKIEISNIWPLSNLEYKCWGIEFKCLKNNHEYYLCCRMRFDAKKPYFEEFKNEQNTLNNILVKQLNEGTLGNISLVKELLDSLKELNKVTFPISETNFEINLGWPNEPYENEYEDFSYEIVFRDENNTFRLHLQSFVDFECEDCSEHVSNQISIEYQYFRENFRTICDSLYVDISCLSDNTKSKVKEWYDWYDSNKKEISNEIKEKLTKEKHVYYCISENGKYIKIKSNKVKMIDKDKLITIYFIDGSKLVIPYNRFIEKQHTRTLIPMNCDGKEIADTILKKMTK